MNYFEYVEEVAKFSDTVEFRTDMSILHKAYSKLLEEQGEPPLKDISKVIIRDNNDTKHAIDVLVRGCINGYTIRGGNISDGVMLSDLQYRISRGGARQSDIQIDFWLVMVPSVRDTDVFKNMQSELTGCQQHRNYT